ncbi:MAG: hypothetical protein JWN80_2674 [Microbacteriaceae bacterium]|nr:hypothetical protein [Microbacteriaceae bacterium]
MAAIEPMLVDYETLPPAEAPVRVRATRPRAAEVPPTLPLWDDEVLARIERARAAALERDDVIRSLADFEHLLGEIDLVPAEQVAALPDGTEVFVAGRRVSRTREGTTIVVTLLDGTGTCDVMFAPEKLGAGELVLVSGIADGSAVRANESWDLRVLLRRYQS